GPTVVGIMGCKLGIDPRQVENRSDLANQVIVGNGLFKTKRVKQPTLVVIEPPHHRPTPPRIVSERRNHCSREPSTTFATKSAKTGHKQLQQIAALFDRLVEWTSNVGEIVMPGATHRLRLYWTKFAHTAKYKIKPQATAIDTSQIAIFPNLGTLA